jgi:hypothetical protein
LGKIEAVRHNVRNFMGIRARRRIVSVPIKGRATVLSQFAGAFVRAFLVMVLVATPSVLLPGVGSDGKQMVALVAIFAGMLTFVEYNATYPGLIEFRDAPPYNRIRFLMLFAIVFFLAILQRPDSGSSDLGDLVSAVGIVIGQAMDFPYSPVRLATLMVSGTSPMEHVYAVRDAAGVAYLLSLVALAIFVIALRLANWPTQNRAFNVWVNLPTFDPTAGGDVVTRLERDAGVNVALGFLLPFLIPAVMKFSGMGLGALQLTTPQTLIWVVAAWAFLPASLFMRGIAMRRIAGIIRQTRERGGLAPEHRFFPV